MIELKQIAKQYKGQGYALNDIDVYIPAGQFVSIVGPSGAGKTTLIRLLNGMISPSSGEIILFGERFDRKRGSSKRKIQQSISTIFQNFCLVGNSTVRNNVLNADLAHMSFFRVLFGLFTKEQIKRAENALQEVGLLDKAEVKANTLSGGQQQRVAIARALMQNSKLLLADEPVSALDPVTAKQILDLIKSLQKKHHLTVLMNSHNVELACRYSERVLGLKDGRLVLDKAAKEVTKEDLAKIYEKGSLESETMT